MNLKSIFKVQQHLSTIKNYNQQILTLIGGLEMCEFKVILNGKEVWNDVVYAKAEGAKVTVKDVAGQTKEFKNCKIIEVDVNTTRLVLAGS